MSNCISMSICIFCICLHSTDSQDDPYFLTQVSLPFWTSAATHCYKFIFSFQQFNLILITELFGLSLHIFAAAGRLTVS